MPDDDPAAKIRQSLSTMSAAEQKDLLDFVLAQRRDAFEAALREPPLPTLRPTPRRIRGFRIRLDLLGVKPPVWRRLIVAGDLRLNEVHAVIQAAMGWSDYHLHRFRTGADYRSPHFVTEFDLEEGDEGILEDDVRLDRVVGEVGDRLWYEYDFGDGWDHVLKVEEVLKYASSEVELVTGRRACPPEDVGGVGGYQAVAAWVESGYDPALVPEQFESAEHGRDWLPEGWDPAVFDRDLAASEIRYVLGNDEEPPGGQAQ